MFTLVQRDIRNVTLEESGDDIYHQGIIFTLLQSGYRYCPETASARQQNSEASAVRRVITWIKASKLIFFSSSNRPTA